MRENFSLFRKKECWTVYSLEIAKSLSNKCDLSCLISKNVVNKNQCMLTS